MEWREGVRSYLKLKLSVSIQVRRKYFKFLEPLASWHIGCITFLLMEDNTFKNLYFLLPWMAAQSFKPPSLFPLNANWYICIYGYFICLTSFTHQYNLLSSFLLFLVHSCCLNIYLNFYRIHNFPKLFALIFLMCSFLNLAAYQFIPFVTII